MALDTFQHQAPIQKNVKLLQTYFSLVHVMSGSLGARRIQSCKTLTLLSFYSKVGVGYSVKSITCMIERID